MPSALTTYYVDVDTIQYVRQTAESVGTSQGKLLALLVALGRRQVTTEALHKWVASQRNAAQQEALEKKALRVKQALGPVLKPSEWKALAQMSTEWTPIDGTKPGRVVGRALLGLLAKGLVECDAAPTIMRHPKNGLPLRGNWRNVSGLPRQDPPVYEQQKTIPPRND